MSTSTGRRAAWAVASLATAWAVGLLAAPPDGPAPSRPDSFVDRPRVVVLTDVANEPDDQMSLVRLFVYANQFDIEGLIAGTSTWLKAGPRPDVIHSVIDAYGQVQPNLLRHAPRFPTAASLHAVVAPGQPGYGMAAVGADKATPGSALLLAAMEKDAPRPLWVLGWGGVNTLAQALVTARATRSASQVDALVSRLRVYTISDQDDAGPWLRREFASLRYIATPSNADGEQYASATWTGISGDRYYKNAPGADFTTVSDPWVNANIRAKGPLGKLYPYPCCIHEGDTPSFLGLIDNGLASAVSPAYGGWGGRYVWRRPSGEPRPFWTQGGDSFPGNDSSRDTVVGIDGVSYTSDQATIWRWREAFQHDFAARMDWTIKAPAEANHNPSVVVNGQSGTAPVTVDAQVGVPVTLDAAGTTDPDGNQIGYQWFFYPEAGAGISGQPRVNRQRPPAGAARLDGAPQVPIGLREPPVRVVVENHSTARATVWPKVPGLAHIILAVQDDGSPSLTSYRRVILRIAAAPPLSVPPPVALSAEQDHRRLLDLLGVKALRPGADGRNPQAPHAANYDETKAGPFSTLPDPLVMKDGIAVTTAAAWTGRRRAELLEEFDREIYGRVPVQLPAVAWRVTDVKAEVVGGVPVVTRTLAGRVDNRAYPAVDVEIELSLTIPASATAPVPLMMEFGFRFPSGMPRPFRPAGAPPEPPSWQEQVLAKGWGYAIVYPNSIQADGGAGLTRGIIGLVNKGQPRKLADWGVLRAWAWGASRALDYLETDPAVNARQIGIDGMSRYGKAALVAMAYDERFAIAYIASSGQGGAKLHRRDFGERVENAAGSDAYHWVAGNYLKYAGPLTPKDIPVDQHELIALCAPRPVFISAGAVEGDGWADPKGMFLAAVGAGPVYRLLGKRDLGATTFPPIETALVTGEIAFRQHTAGHTPVPNWPAFIAFAERYLHAPVPPAAGPGGPRRIALTFDDLPVDGPMPPGVTRVDVADATIGDLDQALARKGLTPPSAPDTTLAKRSGMCQ
jgi:hypothetical protein